MKPHELMNELQYGESIEVECKKASNSLPKSVWETYSSFANTNGGTIYLGVDESKNNHFEIVGVDCPEKIIKDFWDTISSDKVSSNILLEKDVRKECIDGKSVVIIHVPRADYKHRPVYINGNPMKGTYKRNYEGDYHCTEEEVKAMLRDANDSGNDGGLLNGYTMDDIDANSLRSYRIEFEHRNPEHIWNGETDKTFLKNLGGYALDRTTGKEWLTAAGLLMFGKGIAIRDRFGNIRMDYIDESDLLPDSRWSDRLTYDGTWENNLYNFMRQVIPRLVSGLKRPFRLEGMVRIDDTPIHRAIREAVVNMMIHSDYLITGVLKIVKTEKGFLFSNPGNLKLPIQAIYEGGHSVARNPRIQTMFRMIGYGDNIGSGFPTILSAWGEENWRKPDLQQNEALHQVELKLWMISLMPKECTDYLIKHYGNDYLLLDSHAQLIVGTAYLENGVTNSRMQSILEMNSVEIGQVLSTLVQQGFLIAHKNGRWTRYYVNTEYKVKRMDVVSQEKQNAKQISSNTTDQIIYEYIKSNEFITTSKVLEITKISTPQGANVALGRLMKAGFVEKVRKGKRFFYRLKTDTPTE